MRLSKYLLITIPLIAVILSSCKKEEHYPSHKELVVKNTNGIVSVIMNGKPFSYTGASATYEKNNDGRWSIEVQVFERDLLSQALDLIHIPNSKAYIPLREFSGENSQNFKMTKGIFSNTNGDATVASYYIVEDSVQSFIKVNEYNESTNEVSGEFGAVFYFESGTQQPGFTDTLRFTEGKFQFKISQPNNQ